MSDNYLQYPTTVKELAGELVKICDDYKSRRISNTEIKSMVEWYAKKTPDMLFSFDEINPTIRKIIGKRRERIVVSLLPNTEV